jgi:hypothetical protein
MWRYTPWILNSALDIGELSVSRFCRFTFRRTSPCTHWLSPRAGLDTLALSLVTTLTELLLLPLILGSVSQFIWTTRPWVESRDSSVDIKTDDGLDYRGSVPSRGERLFSPPQPPDRLWGRLNFLFTTYRGLFPLGHEADHSPQSSAEVKYSGAIPPFPLVSSWCGHTTCEL